MVTRKLAHPSSEANLEEVALTAVNDAMGEASLQDVYGTTVYGNEEGLGLLRDRQEINRRLSRLELKVQTMTEELKNLKEDNNHLKAGYSTFSRIRHRFLETFKRDVLGIPSSSSLISSGNETAHEGDVVNDSRLYLEGNRTDGEVFSTLYGARQK